MTWKEFVDGAAAVAILPEYHNRRGVPKKVVEKVLRSVFVKIADEAIHGRRVTIPGFGVFVRSVRKARKIANPITKEPIMLPVSTTIRFRASRNIKR